MNDQIPNGYYRKFSTRQSREQCTASIFYRSNGNDGFNGTSFFLFTGCMLLD